MAIGEKAEVPDFGKALRKDVHQKTTDELMRIESHRSCTVVLFLRLGLAAWACRWQLICFAL